MPSNNNSASYGLDYTAMHAYHPGKFLKKFLRGMSVHENLGMILESKVGQKLSLEKNVFTKKWSPKLIFLDEFFF